MHPLVLLPPILLVPIARSRLQMFQVLEAPSLRLGLAAGSSAIVLGVGPQRLRGGGSRSTDRAGSHVLGVVEQIVRLGEGHRRVVAARCQLHAQGLLLTRERWLHS